MLAEELGNDAIRPRVRGGPEKGDCGGLSILHQLKKLSPHDSSRDAVLIKEGQVAKEVEI